MKLGIYALKVKGNLLTSYALLTLPLARQSYKILTLAFSLTFPSLSRTLMNDGLI